MIDTRMYWLPEDLKPKVFKDIYGNDTPTWNWWRVINNANSNWSAWWWRIKP